MVQPGEDAGLDQKDLDILGPGDPLPLRDLDGHTAVEFVVVRQEDPAEAPLAEEPHDPIAADPLGTLRSLIVSARSLSPGRRPFVGLPLVSRLVHGRASHELLFVVPLGEAVLNCRSPAEGCNIEGSCSGAGGAARGPWDGAGHGRGGSRGFVGACGRRKGGVAPARRP
jgi:hypothetical protein